MNLKIVTDEAMGKGKGKKSAPQKKQITRWLPPKRQRIMMLQPIRHELLAEMVWEILIRLPVESLARFKLVSKAWQAIISNPVFIRAHLFQTETTTQPFFLPNCTPDLSRTKSFNHFFHQHPLLQVVFTTKTT
jgi:hypothetical protein